MTPNEAKETTMTMTTNEFFAEATHLGLRVHLNPEDQRAAFDAKDAEIQRLRSELELRSRGECICVRCGLRQEAASPQDMSNDPPFMF